MGKIQKNKTITNKDLLQHIRRDWNMNPATRIQQDQRKNKKKLRQKGKKIIREAYDPFPFFVHEYDHCVFFVL